MKKRILSILLAFVMVFSLLPVTAFADPTWTGSGKEEAPYQIGTLDDLNKLATEVNGGQDMSGVYFKLTADIGDATTPFRTPIGNYTYQFKGNFDGDGHTVYLTISGSSYLGLFGCLNGGSIKNVTTAGKVEDTSKSVTGNGPVAGVCAHNIGGTIENCVNKAAVSCKDYGKYMGGICGKNEGGTINGCSNTAQVTAWGYDAMYFGGICGQNYTGSILNCVNSGSIYTCDAYRTQTFGGICGQNGGFDTPTLNAMTADAIIANCVNTGEIRIQNYGSSGTCNEIGGICGANKAGATYESMVVNCYNRATMTGTKKDNTPRTSNMGGVVGYNYELATGKAVVSNCYFATDVSHVTYGATLATEAVTGHNTAVTNTLGMTSAQMKAASGAALTTGVADNKPLVDLLNGYKDSGSYPTGWKKWEVEDGNYPAFAAPAWTGSGTEEAPYQIVTLNDLNKLATKVNGGQDMSGEYFKLTADIGDATTPFSTPIGNYTNQFKGNFDGDGHTVTLNISGSKYLGLFGCLNGGSIKNVTTAGTVGNQKTANINLAAGVCARNIGGTIENCVNKAAVSCGNYGNGMGGICGLNEGGTINGCSNTAMIKAWGINAKYFGGICGQNYTGSILNCVNSGEVKAIEWAINGMGGICGLNGGVDDTTLNAMTADAIIANCVNNGKVNVQGYNENGASEIGGICGRNNAGTTHKGMVVNCFSTGVMSYPVSASSTVPVINSCGSVVGYNWEKADNGKAIVSNCYYDTTAKNTLATATVGSTNFQHVTNTLGLTTDQMKAASGAALTTGVADNKPLVDLLNGYKDSGSYPTGWKKWEVADGNYPTFAAPTVKIGEKSYVTLAEALAAAQNGDEIKLTQDLTLDSSITIPAGKDITLDLNGHVINANGGNFSVITLTDSALTLNDSTPTTEHYFTVGDDGLWTLTDTKTETTKTVKGGVITGGRGCYTTDGKSSTGGGVYIESKTAESTFTMNGGTICGNTAAGYGGGVYVIADQANATFNMNGGTICGNTAPYGGGMLFSSDSGKTNVTFNMNGGTICGNTAEYGGGVLILNNTMSYLGGTTVIKDNYAGQKASNLVIYGANNIIYLGTKTGSEEGNGVLKPADGMVVGVSLVKMDAAEDGKMVFYPISGDISARKMTADDLKYFFSDSTDYNLDFIDGTKPNDLGDYLSLKEIPSVTQIGDKTYKTFAEAIAAAQVGDTIKLISDITIAEQLVIDKAITFDGNGKTITRTPGGATAADKAGILVTAGATITDLTVSGPNTTASGWDSGEFGIKLFNANGATLNGVTVTGANAGIQVNGGSVTMKNNITVSGNEYGGIELCHGGALDLSAATLVNAGETEAAPTLWNDDTKGTITFSASQPLSKKIADANKDHYYLISDKQMVSLNGQNYLSLADAIAEVQNNSTITLLKDNSETITVNKLIAFRIDANGKTFTPANISADTGYERIMSTESGVTTYKFRNPVTFDTEAAPVNGGNAITYGTTYEVTPPTVSDANGALVPQPEMTFTYYESNGQGGWTVLEAKPTDAGSYKVVIAVKDDNATYTGSKEYTFSIAKADVATPTDGVGYTVDYAAEKINVTDGYEVSTSTDFTTTLAGGTDIVPGTTYYVRKASDDNHNVSAAVSFNVPARPAAPGSAPAFVSKTATTITVTAVAGQEYSADGATWFSEASDGKVTITGLTADTAYSIIARVKATSSAFASGKSEALSVITKSSEDSKIVIDPVEVKDNNIKSDGDIVVITPASGTDIPADKLNAVATAINKVLTNEGVASYTDLRLEEATDDSNDSIIEDLKAETDDDIAKGNVIETDISKYLNVKLVSATVDTDETVTVTAMTFDVTPMATITVTGSSGEVKLTTEIDKYVDGEVTFRLPVDGSITATTAAVYHETEFIGNYNIKGSAAKYLEVSTSSFSKFGYITLDRNTAGAEIDGVLYASLADAVSRVTDGQKITLLKDASGTIMVSREVEFTVEDNGMTNGAAITAGVGYTMQESNNTYTFTKDNSLERIIKQFFDWLFGKTEPEQPCQPDVCCVVKTAVAVTATVVVTKIIVDRLHALKTACDTAAEATPVIKAEEMPMVAFGDSNDAVKTLQTKLNALGYNCGEADGIFGNDTYTAVCSFQMAKGLTADGMVGTQTWAELLG